MTTTADHVTTPTADPLVGASLERHRLAGETLAELRSYLTQQGADGATHVPIAGIRAILAGRAPRDPFLDHDRYALANYRRTAWAGNR